MPKHEVWNPATRISDNFFKGWYDHHYFVHKERSDGGVEYDLMASYLRPLEIRSNVSKMSWKHVEMQKKRGSLEYLMAIVGVDHFSCLFILVGFFTAKTWLPFTFA